MLNDHYIVNSTDSSMFIKHVVYHTKPDNIFL